MHSLMRRSGFYGAMLVAFAVLGSCAAARQSGAADETERTILAVDNQSFSDITVYLVEGGQRIRLGRVSSKRSADLTIPASYVRSARELQFLIDLFGLDRAQVSNRTWVTPGERVTMIIPP